MADKVQLEWLMGVPLPGQYEDLKGIDLWGDGKVVDREPSKSKVTKHISGAEAPAVAKKTAKFKILKENPLFVGMRGVIPFDEFVSINGNIVDKDTYDMITEMYTQHTIFPEQEQAVILYESASGNVFSNTYYPIILDSMAKPTTKKHIHNVVSDFIDRNTEVLSKRYPTANVMLNKGEVDTIIHLSGVRDYKNVVLDMLSDLDAKTDFKSISKSPHQVIFAAMLMAATENDDKSLIEDMITLVAFTMYPLIFRKYFPRTDPNEAAMEEAVTTASKKFYITRTSSVLEWIRLLTEVPYKFYKDKFASKSKTDMLYVQFINRLRNTMNQQVKSLYAIYKKAYDNKGIGKLSDAEFVTLGSNADMIQIYTMGIVDKIGNMGFRQKVCEAAAEYTRTSEEAVQKCIKEFMSDYKKYGLQSLVQNMLVIYYNIGNKQDFLAVAIRQYPKIWTSKDKIYVAPKEYLSELEDQLKEALPDYIHAHLFGMYIYYAILINISLNSIANKLSSAALSKNDKDDDRSEGNS